MKKFLSVVLALSLVGASSVNSFAAAGRHVSTVGTVETYEATVITPYDLARLEKVINGDSANGIQGVGLNDYDKVQDHKNSGAHIVNAKMLTKTEWVVRIKDNGSGQNYNGDYYVHIDRPYVYDTNPIVNKALNMPTEAESTTKYGPSWFWFGLFADGDGVLPHGKEVGVAVAQRIKRWPEWNDLSFTGRTWNGPVDSITHAEGTLAKPYTGSLIQGAYDTPSSETYTQDHLVKPENRIFN